MEIALLIYKKLTSTLQESEKMELDQWLSVSEENRFLFQSIENYHKNGGDISKLSQLDASDAWEKVLRQHTLNRRKKTQRILRSTYKYAAILILGLVAGYMYLNHNSRSETILNDTVQEQDGIVIVFDNGEKIELSSSEEQELLDKDGNKLGKRNGHQLNYATSGETMDELVYNTLTVPNGQRFDIVLSDNSHVYLNAGSSLRYPVAFLSGKKRQVFLEGEAFFDVAKDKEHPFVVTSGNMDVEVLGTQFNVSAYPEENDINTVLVEGSVRLEASGEQNKDEASSLILEPGFKASWDRESKSAKTEEVDTDIYTSWVHGKLVIKGMKFKDITKKLERHYGVSISNGNEALNDRIFTATFDVETIEEVLNTFVSETKFDYKIEGKQITILNNQKP